MRILRLGRAGEKDARKAADREHDHDNKGHGIGTGGIIDKAAEGRSSRQENVHKYRDSADNLGETRPSVVISHKSHGRGLDHSARDSEEDCVEIQHRQVAGQ